jgi:hypothetical protein
MSGVLPLFYRPLLHAYVLTKEDHTMGSYNLDELIVLWEREKLTTEQTIGQILLALQALSERLRELERRHWRRAREENANDDVS